MINGTFSVQIHHRLLGVDTKKYRYLTEKFLGWKEDMEEKMNQSTERAENILKALAWSSVTLVRMILRRAA